MIDSEGMETMCDGPVRLAGLFDRRKVHIEHLRQALLKQLKASLRRLDRAHAAAALWDGEQRIFGGGRDAIHDVRQRFWFVPEQCSQIVQCLRVF